MSRTKHPYQFNTKHPYWREGFPTTGIEALRNVGFTYLGTQEEDGRYTVVRRQGDLSLYIELDPAQGSNSRITCQWMNIREYEAYPVVFLTLLLWEGIVNNGWSNQALLYRARELTFPISNQMEYNERRAIWRSNFILPSGKVAEVWG